MVLSFDWTEFYKWGKGFFYWLLLGFLSMRWAYSCFYRLLMFVVVLSSFSWNRVTLEHFGSNFWVTLVWFKSSVVLIIGKLDSRFLGWTCSSLLSLYYCWTLNLEDSNWLLQFYICVSNTLVWIQILLCTAAVRNKCIPRPYVTFYCPTL